MKKLLLLAAALIGGLSAHAQNNIDAGTGWIAASNVTVNGKTYDQVVLNGQTVTAHADSGQILRISMIDPSNDIIQIEFSGSGSIKVSLLPSPTPQYNITQPTGYLQDLTGYPGYAKGVPVIEVTNSSTDTYLTVYSVGPANGNAALFDATHQGGQTSGVYKGHVADVAGIYVAGSAINSILCGNAQVEILDAFSTTVVNRVVIHGQADYSWRIQFGGVRTYSGYIGIGPSSTLSQDSGAVLIAGGNLVSPCALENVSTLRSQAGSDSAGNSISAQTISSTFHDIYGNTIYPTILY